jgi:predicted DNA-binding transcriptional regulator YafY
MDVVTDWTWSSAGVEMGRKKQPANDLNLTPSRAARLYKLLTVLDSAPHTRLAIRRKLRVDTRGFYRDLDALRKLGIEIAADGDGRYSLCGTLEEALTRFPMPDPGLNVREALQLVNGVASAQQKLKRKVEAFLKSPTGRPNKPR